MSKIKITVNPEYEANSTLRNFIEHLPDIFVEQGVTLYDKRNVIKSFSLDIQDKVLCNVVVKRHKKPNLLQRIVYSFFRSSKAKRAFYNARELRHRGIDTPQEVAYIEQRGALLFKYGYYVSGCDNAPPIIEKLVHQPEFDRAMANDFASFAMELHKKGILHHDLNPTNVLYRPTENAYHFSVIDINRMDFLSEGEFPSMKDCLENLTRFTGRMDLFEYVLRCYVEKRGWDIELAMQDAFIIKKRHDDQRRRRKAFLRKLSLKKK